MNQDCPTINNINNRRKGSNPEFKETHGAWCVCVCVCVGVGVCRGGGMGKWPTWSDRSAGPWCCSSCQADPIGTPPAGVASHRLL